MKKCPLLLMVFSMCASGCQVVSHGAVRATPGAVSLVEAQQAFDEGQYYQARKAVGRVLDQDPDNAEAQSLMAVILEQEISTQKEVFENKVPDEYTRQENSQQAKTWLERARELFRRERYEDAMIAAEKVFTFDAQNLEASALIDQIRTKVYSEGKQQAVFLKHMYQDEMALRVSRYKEEAEKWIDKGQFGAAKLTLEKAILLDPSNPELSRLYEQIQKREAPLS